MAQKCVFCGKDANKKNKEHVIPQWLIRYAGCEQAYIIDEENRKIPFMRFTVPACTACNSRYSDWEGNVKTVMTKVLTEQSISGQEMDLLLDWFDKVRVGIWLANNNLYANMYDFNPALCIDNRIGLHDRMLIIERLNIAGQGILVNGCMSPLFIHNPSVFQMIINNYSFTNVSYCNLVSRKLGFPVLTDLEYVADGQMSGKVTQGYSKATLPVLRSVNPLPHQTVVYQPVFKFFQTSPVCDNEYIRAHSLDFDAGHGGIFYQKNSGPLKYAGANNRINLSCKPAVHETISDSLRRTYNLQTIVNQIPIRINTGDSNVDMAVRHKQIIRSKFNMLLSSAFNTK
jgi:hypothetical protein